jgi:hypothetical protein
MFLQIIYLTLLLNPDLWSYDLLFFTHVRFVKTFSKDFAFRKLKTLLLSGWCVAANFACTNLIPSALTHSWEA